MIRGAIVGVAVFLVAVSARADVAMAWSGATGTIVVAHDGRIEGFDRTGATRLWSAEGLESPSAIVVSKDGASLAILDGFEDRVAVVSVTTGAVERYAIPGTPVAAAFFGGDLWVVLRDRNRVVRITPKGDRTEIAVSLDPALIAVSDLFVYVYSRAEGLLQEIDPNSAQLVRSQAIGTAGSDLEVRLPKPGDAPGAVAYLCRPAHGAVVVVNLVPMESREMTKGLSAPIDLMFVPLGSMLSIDPGTSVIVDPGKPGMFVSSSLGGGRVISHPTAVDRIMIAEAGLFTFDSNSGTVYRFDGRVTKVATGQTATSFVPTNEALFTWDAKAGKLQRQ